MYQKNDLVTVTITDMGTAGEGIGKLAGYTLFIKDAVIGDMVEAKIMKAKKAYAYARLERIIEPSPDRVEAVCPYARPCGGCQIQQLSYEKQLVYKENRIRNNLQRIGGFDSVPMERIIGMEDPFHYRNKAQYPVDLSKDGRIITGFYAGRTHDIIESMECMLGPKIDHHILDAFLTWARAHQEELTRKDGQLRLRHVLIRHGFTSGEIMVCLIARDKDLPDVNELIKSLCAVDGMKSISLNINTRNDNVILGDKVVSLWGEPYITDYIGDIAFHISPLSFYQVNPIQTKKLYEQALTYAELSGCETVWDLYCGIGTISLFLAQKADNVYGVEVVSQAIEDAKNNAKLNGITNAHFAVGASEDLAPTLPKPDVIVVDPPRKGCADSLLHTMLAAAPEKIVYVSCDSATLARDLKVLCEGGYHLERVRGVDQFPQTVHVESVILLSRVEGTKRGWK